MPAILDYLRWCASPGAWKSLVAMNKDIDVRHVLPAIRVPTLILHGTGDTAVPIEAAGWMATKVPGAQLIEIPGGGHLHFASDWPLSTRKFALSDRRLGSGCLGGGRAGPRARHHLLHRHRRLQRARRRARRSRVAGAARPARCLGASRAAPLQGTGDRHGGRWLPRHVRRPSACDPLRLCDGQRRQGAGLDIRVGLHTGECELSDGKIAGIAVHTGARVASCASAGEVLVSHTVKDLVAGSGLHFRIRVARAQGHRRRVAACIGSIPRASRRSPPLDGLDPRGRRSRNGGRPTHTNFSSWA